ncbi:MAG: translation initiation factor [Duncaniella sp.]|nr:translation initiation factor [Bacteroides sp.]MDE6066597.1 translation initiation factor [Duncaniella sp.]
MDWKDILASKVNDGTLDREEFVAEEPVDIRKPDVLHVTIDRKGRKGKTATIIEGFTCPESELLDIAARLKSQLGTGGSARGGEILIQGECVDKVRRLLSDMGYKVK